MEQQQKGELKQDQEEPHSQALSEGSITMEEAQSQKTRDTKEDQHVCQKVSDPNHEERKQFDLCCSRPKPKQRMTW